MAVKNNLVNQFMINGWRMTSDPTKQPGGFGVRQLYAYGANVDAYCNGVHAAFDCAKRHGVRIGSPVNAVVLRGTGWNTFGWTTVLGFIDGQGHARQLILGHLNKNPLNFLKVGQEIKKGDLVGHQGTSNNLGVKMASHLHVQVQNFASLNEWNFTCVGLNPYNIDVSNTKPAFSGTKPNSSSSTKKASKSKTFNGRQNRPLSSTAYVKGTVDSLGAQVRNRNGNNFNRRAGYDIQPGATVYIFQQRNGWLKIYTGRSSGHGANDWIWHERFRPQHVYK